MTDVFVALALSVAFAVLIPTLFIYIKDQFCSDPVPSL